MKKHIVDGFIFTKKLDGSLLIEFKVGGIVHTLRLTAAGAKNMAKVFDEFYLQGQN